MLFSLHTRLRVHWAPGFPCALLSEARTVFAKPGRIAPRERGVLFWKLGQRHCEERKDANRHCERSEAIHSFFARRDRGAVSAVIARSGSDEAIHSFFAFARRDRGAVSAVIARSGSDEAIHSFFARRERWIASRSLSIWRLESPVSADPNDRLWLMEGLRQSGRFGPD